MAGKTVKAKPTKLARSYLLVYNVLQFFGWSHVLFQTLNFYLKSEPAEKGDLWEAVNPTLLIFQTGAVLEVVNVALGLVHTSLFNTFFQVTSRLGITWLALYCMPGTRTTIGLPLLLVAWCVTEIVRYSYYALGILNNIPYFITWARYTFFYALYPIGVAGELLVTFSTLAVKEQSFLHFNLPNAANFSIDFSYLVYLALAFYVFIFPVLFGHMISQRRKVLGSSFFDNKKGK